MENVNQLLSEGTRVALHESIYSEVVQLSYDDSKFEIDSACVRYEMESSAIRANIKVIEDYGNEGNLTYLGINVGINRASSKADLLARLQLLLRSEDRSDFSIGLSLNNVSALLSWNINRINFRYVKDLSLILLPVKQRRLQN